MKAFENWRNKTGVCTGINFRSGQSYKAEARVWRAALEWVKTQGDKMQDAKGHYYDIHADVFDKELEDTDES